MFCTNCGTQNEDSRAFCSECGAKLVDAAPAAAATTTTAPTATFAEIVQKNKKLFIMLGAGLAVVIAILCIILGNAHRSPKAIVNKYLKAYFAADGKAVTECLPEKLVKNVADDMDITKKEFIEKVDESTTNFKDSLKESYGKNYSVKYTVLAATSVDPEYKDYYIEYYEDRYNVKVTDIKEVIVILTLKHDGERETDQDTMRAIQVDGKWYIDFDTLREMM